MTEQLNTRCVTKEQSLLSLKGRAWVPALRPKAHSLCVKIPLDIRLLIHKMEITNACYLPRWVNVSIRAGVLNIRAGVLKGTILPSPRDIPKRQKMML